MTLEECLQIVIGGAMIDGNGYCANDPGEFCYCPDGIMNDDENNNGNPTVVKIVIASIALQSLCCLIFTGCTASLSCDKMSLKRQLKKARKSKLKLEKQLTNAKNQSDEEISIISPMGANAGPAVV